MGDETMEAAPTNIDPLVQPLLLDQADEQADELVTQLIKEHAQPLVKGVVRYKLRLNQLGMDPGTEAEDIYQEVILQLITQLQRFRNSPQEHPITDLRGITAVIAHRTCARWLRRHFPERHSLKNRLHYLLTRQRGFSIWHDQNETTLAGYQEWQRTNRSHVAIPQSADETLIRSVRLQEKGGRQTLGNTVAAIFDFIGGPVEFDELVSFTAGLLGVRDHSVESLTDDDDSGAFEPIDEQPDVAWQFEKRTFLSRLWEELQQLPINQRAALLLNLRDNTGRGALTLFPITGIASVRQLAEVAGMNVEAFAQLWNELPLEDARIAELLGITRQQVINSRKSGRERLSRRLKGFF
jgi:RNA polymerase sigma factor (sigma-70 family)